MFVREMENGLRRDLHSTASQFVSALGTECYGMPLPRVIVDPYRNVSCHMEAWELGGFIDPALFRGAGNNVRMPSCPYTNLPMLGQRG